MRIGIALLAATIAFGQSAIQQNYDTRSYNWSRTNGSGTTGNLSAAGSHALTLAPCPAGLVPAASGTLQIRIQGGIGTGESVLITAFSSGTANCTITFTTGNSHTGAWVVSSSTGGFGEIGLVAPAGSAIVVGASISAYATITLANTYSVQCSSGITITQNFSGASVSLAPLLSVTGSNVTIQSCGFNGNSQSNGTGAPASVVMVNGVSNFSLLDSQVENGGSRHGLYLQSVSGAKILRNWLHGNPADQLVSDSGSSQVRVEENLIDNTGCTVLFCAGAYIASAASPANNNLVLNGGNESQGLLEFPPTAQTFTANNNVIIATGNNIFEQMGTSGNFSASGNFIGDGGITQGANFFAGWETGASTNSTITGNTISLGTTSGAATGIAIDNVQSNGNISGNVITMSGTAANIGIALEGAANSYNLEDNVVGNNTINFTGTNARGILLTGFGFTSLLLRNHISGNHIHGSGASGQIGVYVSSNSTSLCQFNSILGNTIDNTPVGLLDSACTSDSILNNRITNSANPVEVSADVTPLIDDINGVTVGQTFGPYVATPANGSRVYFSDSNARCTAGSSSGQICTFINGAWQPAAPPIYTGGALKPLAFSQFGSCTLGTNCAVTLSPAYTNTTTYQCSATDQTAAAAVKVVNTSASVVTFTGTGTDVISYVCTGN